MNIEPVIVQVCGGVIEIVSNPSNVPVELRDYDIEDDGAENIVEDETGRYAVI